MKEALFPRRDALRRGGFTLVEVVIALAIFVFGAVAIIRIFPPALGIIQNSGDKLTANNLNRTLIARLTKDGAPLPESVHDTYITADIPDSGAVAVVGTSLRNNSMPRRGIQIPDDPNNPKLNSALGRFKFITGEKHFVKRTLVLNQSGIGTHEVYYVVTNYPIAGVTPPNQLKLFPAAKIYQDTKVTGVVSATRAIPTALPPGRYSGFLDFTNANPSFTASTSTDDFYYVSYQYLENGKMNAVTNEALRVFTPDNPATLSFSINDTPNSPHNVKARLLQGRRFVPSPLSASAQLFDSRVPDGPVTVRFRHQMADLSVPAIIGRENNTDDRIIQNTLNNVGLLVVTKVANISEGLEIYVDYRINNWQQIVHNGTPSLPPEATPTPGNTTIPPTPMDRTPREVVLPIKAMTDAEDGTAASQSAAEVYGLMSYIDPGIDPNIPTLQANGLDVSNNQATLVRQGTLNPTDPASDLSTNNPFFLWDVKRKGGRVLFDTNDHSKNLLFPPAEVAVVDARVVYQTLDNWTQQLSVAPSSYTPFYNYGFNNINTADDFTGTPGNINVAEPWRYYCWSASSTQPGRIFFPPSEAGKTISISYSYLVGGVEKEVENGVVTISPVWVRDGDAPANTGTLNPRDLAVADTNRDKWLAYAEPQPSGSTSLPITSIRSIKGLSVQARTAWLDGANFTQVSTTGFRGGSN